MDWWIAGGSRFYLWALRARRYFFGQRTLNLTEGPWAFEMIRLWLLRRRRSIRDPRDKKENAAQMPMTPSKINNNKLLPRMTLSF